MPSCDAENQAQVQGNGDLIAAWPAVAAIAEAQLKDMVDFCAFRTTLNGMFACMWLICVAKLGEYIPVTWILAVLKVGKISEAFKICMFRHARMSVASGERHPKVHVTSGN